MADSLLVSAPAFPVKELEDRLSDELVRHAVSTASLKGIAMPETPADQISAPIQIDSLVVVEILCAIEPILGFEVKDSLVKAGGYRSVKQALTHLMPRLEEAWTKRKGGKNERSRVARND